MPQSSLLQFKSTPIYVCYSPCYLYTNSYPRADPWCASSPRSTTSCWPYKTWPYFLTTIAVTDTKSKGGWWWCKNSLVCSQADEGSPFCAGQLYLSWSVLFWVSALGDLGIGPGSQDKIQFFNTPLNLPGFPSSFTHGRHGKEVLESILQNDPAWPSFKEAWEDEGILIFPICLTTFSKKAQGAGVALLYHHRVAYWFEQGAFQVVKSVRVPEVEGLNLQPSPLNTAAVMEEANRWPQGPTEECLKLTPSP